MRSRWYCNGSIIALRLNEVQYPKRMTEAFVFYDSIVLKIDMALTRAIHADGVLSTIAASTARLRGTSGQDRRSLYRSGAAQRKI